MSFYSNQVKEIRPEEIPAYLATRSDIGTSVGVTGLLFLIFFTFLKTPTMSKKNIPPTPQEIISSLHNEDLTASESKSLLSEIIVFFTTHIEIIERQNIEKTAVQTHRLHNRLFKLLDYAESTCA